MTDRTWPIATKLVLLLLIPPAAILCALLLLLAFALMWCCVPFCRVYLDECGVWAFEGPGWMR